MRAIAAALLASTLLWVGAAAAQERLFAKSVALVIGIGDYPSRSGFAELTYPRKDAGGMAAFLRAQNFQVVELFDEKATRDAILAKLQDEIVPSLGPDDRVLVFYSGHGQTRSIGNKDYGYIIPYDADGRTSSWIGMDLLRNISEQMGQARHQMFIMDACYGGQIGVKAGPGVALEHPDYVRAVAERPARQFLTAGGADQQVLDGGPDGYSYFTGYLLEALELGYGDLNGDGYITASELAAYITPRASTWNQTPAAGVLPGHGQGEFLFDVPGRRIASAPGAVDAFGRFKGAGEATPAGGELAGGDIEIEPSGGGGQVAAVDPTDDSTGDVAGDLSLDEATRRLTEAITSDYSRTKKVFYRFLQANSRQDIDSRQLKNIHVTEVVEVREDGWIADLQYFVVDASRRERRQYGRFLVRPTEDGVEFLEMYQ